MTTVGQIKSDSVKAFKARDKAKDSTLRLLISELEKEKVQNKFSEIGDLSSEQVLEVINRQIKKLQKEKEAYLEVGRDTEKQDAELEVLKVYLPKQLNEDEIRKEVTHAVELVHRNEIKNPMQYLGQKLKGKADMKLVQQIVKEIQSKLLER